MAGGYGFGRESGRRLVVVSFAVLFAGLIVFALLHGPQDDARALRLPSQAIPVVGEPLIAVSENVAPRRLIDPLQAIRASEELTRAGYAEGDLDPEPESDADLFALVVDLMDDDVPRNGLRAVRRLRRAGRDAIPVLEPALLSRDIQQRQLAAHVLRLVDAPPSDALLQVSVEFLRADLPGDIARTLSWPRPYSAVVLLADHPERARRWVVAGLGSRDRQQRFLCAYLLARAGERQYLAAVCAELLPHLRDNSIWGDAVYSAHGLFRLGTEVLPYLYRARYLADAQMLQLLDLIEADLLSPPGTAEGIAARGKLQNVTNLYIDPILELSLGRPPLPRFPVR